jgi:tRNA nucleotidyltransferase/poly(A) polymerase
MLPTEKLIRANSLIKRIFSFDHEIYLVGGFIRDAILGKRSNDIDIVIKGISPRKFALNLQDDLGGSIVEFRRDGFVRLVLESKNTIDISKLKYSIENDLKRRDITINSIGWSPDAGFIDPINGILDIKLKSLRFNSKKNIIYDPLRLIRIIRIYAETGFTIEQTSLNWCKELSSSLKRVSKERVTYEFIKILESNNWQSGLEYLIKLNMLSRVIPLKNKELSANVKAVSRVINQARKLLKRDHFKSSTMGLSIKGILILEALCIGLDTSAHVKLSRLSLSVYINNKIKTVTAYYGAFKQLNEYQPNLQRLFDLFMKAEDTAFDLLILSGREGLLPELKRYSRIQDNQLIDTRSVMSITGIGEGPELGKLLVALNRARFTGEVKSSGHLISWLKKQ